MIAIWVSILSWAATAGVFQKLEVEDQAGVVFQIQGEGLKSPRIHLEDNSLELSFPNARLESDLGGRIDLESPHLLVRRASAFESSDTVKVLVVLQGTLEGLRDRVKVEPSQKGWRLAIAQPKVHAPTLKLLEEEQQTLAASLPPAKVGGGGRWVALFCLVMAVLLSGVGLYCVRKFRREKWGAGTRKHLIEQLAYCPVGIKAGVGLFKVGSEFVLIGVSPSQVNFLTKLEKLEEQYSQDASLEREAFREAVAGEMKRMFRKPGMPA